MIHRIVTGLLVVAGLLCVPSYQGLAQANRPSEPRPVTLPAVSSEEQWATFDFAGSNGSGNLQLGQPIELSITLGGISSGPMPFVAICESADFESQIVPLKPDPHSPLMNAVATLMPVPHDRLAHDPRVSRLHVTFARSTDTKFERVLTRIIYLDVQIHSQMFGKSFKKMFSIFKIITILRSRMFPCNLSNIKLI